MRQEYEKYTAEDREVWRLLFERQMQQIPAVASAEFIKGLDSVQFQAQQIPNFTQTDSLLLPLTGWRLHVVEGLIPNKEFFELLSNRCFPATTWLRRLDQLDYLEEPDMFHDVFGHVPMLSNQSLCDFLAALSRIALQHIDNPYAIELIARLYWFTIEFGLIQENGRLKIYGAGILSSRGESEYCLKSPVPQRVPFDIRAMFHTPYIKEKYQDKYFVIDSYEQLFDSIYAIEEILEEEISAIV
ncbi:MAG: phenylalanine 4-monooxygenase [Spirosomataceae bacterium]